MQAPTPMRLEKGLVALFVMPWFVTLTCFHGRKNLHRSRSMASLFKRAGNQVFLARLFGRFAYVLNLEPMFLGQLLGVGAELLGE